MAEGGREKKIVYNYNDQVEQSVMYELYYYNAMTGGRE